MTIPRLSESPAVSIVVPTCREAENIPHLVARTFAVLDDAGISAEMVIVDDDSDDGTIEVCEELAQEWPVRLITRVGERGLSTAVIRGLWEAHGDVFVVMDADLSHPPEAIPEFVATCQSGTVDFVIGSRYIDGGEVDESWSWFRQVNSRLATWLARGLSKAKDPMAGFFALTRQTLNKAAKLRPLGYKIGLELIVRCDCREVVELPIHFCDRTHGESKLDLKQQWLYLRHLARLYRARYSGLIRMIQFGVVGLSGVFVDLMTFWAMLPLLPMFAARGIAIGTAMTSNFLINREATFADCESNHPLQDYLRFCIACGLGAVTNWTVSMSAASIASDLVAHPICCATLGIVAGSVLNYLLCCRWVFREQQPVNVPIFEVSSTSPVAPPHEQVLSIDAALAVTD